MRKDTHREKGEYIYQGYKRFWGNMWFQMRFRVIKYNGHLLHVIELRDENGDPSDYTHKNFRILFEETQYKVTDVYQPTPNVFRLSLEVDRYEGGGEMRKYKRGEQIKSLDEMMSKELVIISNPHNKVETDKTYHREWFSSWHIRTCKKLIDNGQVYKAEKTLWGQAERKTK